MIDYRDLLKKYIRHVAQSEGSTFLGDQNTRRGTQWASMSPGEQSELVHLDNEVYREGWYADTPIQGLRDE